MKTNEQLLKEYLEKGGTVKKLDKGEFVPIEWNTIPRKPKSNKKRRINQLYCFGERYEADIDNDNE